ncbi:MAG: endo alpha-1,4 polygalactosaminidase [Planctomycetes bacterium]|nr:endo alpha-1,4 polygalactosaminidase [Planctomycetota bacterium]
MKTLISLLVMSLTSAWGARMIFSEPPEAPRVEPQHDRQSRLAEARTWMYQIDGLDAPGAVEALAASKYPLLVVESGINDRDAGKEEARGMVDRLRRLPDGHPRLVVAYLDVGQAETYRAYWGKDWRGPRSGKPGHPEFLLAADPDGWDGSYQVAYWDKRWQAIWLGPDGVVARLAALGYDGIYLDWIDAYTEPSVVAAAKRAGLNPAAEMITFVQSLREAGRRICPDFLVIAQNGAGLIDADPARYIKAIDAVAFEDTWFFGEGGVAWESPRAGDLRHQDTDPDWTPARRLKQYRKYQDRGRPVFTVDYCLKAENAALVYKEAHAAGLRPLVTRVSLSRMTLTPPPGGGR